MQISVDGSVSGTMASPAAAPPDGLHARPGDKVCAGLEAAAFGK
jgi:hypothetical protein